jgi:glycosyltransferase involved in cell wall biosynthesis
MPITRMQKPTLSVVVTNYNHAHYLPGALKAILSQRRKPDDVIVIDDASTDDSRAIIAKFAKDNPAIRAIYNEKNQGVIPNINYGLHLASGTYVFCGAADDYILPGFFEKLMAMAELHPGVGVVTCDPAILYDDRMVTVPLPLGGIARYLDGDALVRTQRASFFNIAGHASLLHREAALNAGGLLPELRWHSDWFMNYTVAFRHGVAYCPEALSVMRAIATSYSSSSMYVWANQRPVLTELSRLLQEARYADVREAFARSGILMTFDPFFARLALQCGAALSLKRPITVGRIFMNFIWRAHLNELIPERIRRFRRARAKARLERVIHSL